MSLKKIVLSGGPCAGKTTIIDIVKKHLEDKGFCVITVSETATEMIKSGISPQNTGQIVFQKNLLKLQLQKENILSHCAEILKRDVVMILDRGALDGKAYLEKDEFNQILVNYNLDEATLYKSYDAVIFLDSAALGNGVDYTISNNTARSESAEEAAYINTKTYNVWSKHHNLYVIKNESNFENKISKVLDVVNKIIKEMY